MCSFLREDSKSGGSLHRIASSLIPAAAARCLIFTKCLKSRLFLQEHLSYIGLSTPAFIDSDC